MDNNVKERILTSLIRAQTITRLVATQEHNRMFAPALWTVVELLDDCIALTAQLLKEECHDE